MKMTKIKMLNISKCLIGIATIMLQSCDVTDNAVSRCAVIGKV